jgi:Domain of unknown function (DUF305)
LLFWRSISFFRLLKVERKTESQIMNKQSQIVGAPRVGEIRATASKLFVALAVLTFTAALIGRATDHDDQGDPNNDPSWSELTGSMDKMHMAMTAVVRSGNSDIDFVRLMVPHHQAAIDMAKTQLLYGKDPQMRRLAQEIITEQQLEIELMQRWLQQQQHTN